MDQLAETLKNTVSWYVAGGFNLKTFLLTNTEQNVYAVTAIDSPVVKIPASIVVQARIVDDYIVIDADNTDRPLYKKLIEQGIPENKIISAYAGETIPAAEPEKA